MKKITLLLTFIIGIYFTQAQEQTTTKDKFELLKEQSTTKILYDRVAQIAQLTKKSDEALNPIHFKQAFHEIQRSDYLNRLPNLVILEEATERGFANNAIPISILISDFDVLKQEVKQNNLLQMNSQNQFEPTNPSFDYFETHHIALVSPLIKQLKGTKIEFELTNNLVFNTTSNQISKIEANFDNKGFINLSLNKKFTIDF